MRSIKLLTVLICSVFLIVACSKSEPEKSASNPLWDKEVWFDLDPGVSKFGCTVKVYVDFIAKHGLFPVVFMEKPKIEWQEPLTYETSRGENKIEWIVNISGEEVRIKKPATIVLEFESTPYSVDAVYISDIIVNGRELTWRQLRSDAIDIARKIHEEQSIIRQPKKVENQQKAPLKLPDTSVPSASTKAKLEPNRKLLNAVFSGLDEVVRALAEGADVNAVNERGATALLIAVSRRDEAMAELLIAKGADVNASLLQTQQKLVLFIIS